MGEEGNQTGYWVNTCTFKFKSVTLNVIFILALWLKSFLLDCFLFDCHQAEGTSHTCCDESRKTVCNGQSLLFPGRI